MKEKWRDGDDTTENKRQDVENSVHSIINRVIRISTECDIFSALQRLLMLHCLLKG